MGKDDADLDLFWNKLSVRQRENMWKRFEAQRRKDGTDKDYKEAIAGQGRNDKASQLMRLYLKLGATKTPAFQDHVVSLTSKQGVTKEKEWVPLEKMKRKYGVHELKTRVENGSILVRKSLTDPAWPEFQDL